MTGTSVLARLGTGDSQASFRVLLDALSRPGEPRDLPVPQAGPGIVPLALAVVGSPIAVMGDPGAQRQICLATGAEQVAIGEAALVAIYGKADAPLISSLRRGSALVPEGGAKAGLACGALIPAGGGEVTPEISGPGVPGRVRLGVDGVGPEVFLALAEANSAFPAGIDVWLTDDAGRVAGLPRSARLEVI